MNDQRIKLDIDHRGVATVTLNRPEKHNAFNDQMIGELGATFQSIVEQKNARVMILASIGKSFSAGADLDWMQRMADYSYEENLSDANELAQMLKTLNGLPIPTIARVQGSAFGGAIGLIACCDIAIGVTNAAFSLSEVKIGLVPATISPYVISAIGQRAARRYFQTAESFTAQQAQQLGLLSDVVEENKLDARINQFVEQLLVNSPQGMATAKQSIADVVGKPINDALMAQTSETIARIRVSEEGQEGLKAFLEKRGPYWTKN